MPYIPHTDKDVSEILKAVGASSVDEILESLPAALRARGPLNLPKGLSEQELKGLLKGLSEKNSTVEEYSSFLGAGAYNHYIPSAVGSLLSRSEFYTAYTPYQPEISQGTLQAVFEYQTLVCQLTAMDVSNASLYDGASATAEAVLMARRITGKDGVLLSGALHPEYRDTVQTYLKGSNDRISEVLYCTQAGATLPEALKGAVNDNTACVVIQHPNFFGSLEDIERLGEIIHEKKGLLIVVTNEAVSLGLLKPPGELGADIAVGDNQSFGNPLNYGGPYLGYMATKNEFIRQMPGRLVGQTVDRNGKTAFCLTFSTREQHIRRERATSNICTNHGLCALAASIHMASLGSRGLKKLALLNLSKAEYLKERLNSFGIKTAFNSRTFNEFAVRVDKDPDAVLKALLKRSIMGGLSLKRFYPGLAHHILVAATEMNSKEDIDRFAAELSKA
ncbi:MAG: aminomethyl-transferring glycine dehydrogenase subunit GcvPA [Deltaproteobacteria bacterium]|nr:aminomethyl-transferring glycine dehydrogenase subunit GcvPA [Deltaproteobacteria bacterium]